MPRENEGTPYSIRKASSCPESFVSATNGRSSDLLLWAGRLPENGWFFSDIIASVKSLQQRELSGIFTRFPIEPFGTAYRRQRYSIFNKKYISSEKKFLFLHLNYNTSISSL